MKGRGERLRRDKPLRNFIFETEEYFHFETEEDDLQKLHSNIQTFEHSNIQALLLKTSCPRHLKGLPLQESGAACSTVSGGGVWD